MNVCDARALFQRPEEMCVAEARVCLLYCLQRLCVGSRLKSLRQERHCARAMTAQSAGSRPCRCAAAPIDLRLTMQTLSLSSGPTSRRVQAMNKSHAFSWRYPWRYSWRGMHNAASRCQRIAPTRGGSFLACTSEEEKAENDECAKQQEQAREECLLHLKVACTPKGGSVQVQSRCGC